MKMSVWSKKVCLFFCVLISLTRYDVCSCECVVLIFYDVLGNKGTIVDI